ncbi:MAG: alpha-isopropylmalate synthase regulatory domain-containing protein, partial [Pseudomonadota bacterium]
IGLNATNLVMGKHSGRHAFRTKLEELGVEIGDNALQEAFVRFKALADRKKEIYDDDILALVSETQAGDAAERIKLKFLRVICGTEAPQSADIILEIDGKEHRYTANGDGPVDAAFAAVKALVPHEARLELYQVHAVTEGTDAQATVSVRMSENGKITTAQSSDTDTVVASARAYVHALNKLLIRREKSAPDSDIAI